MVICDGQGEKVLLHLVNLPSTLTYRLWLHICVTSLFYVGLGHPRNEAPGVGPRACWELSGDL